MLFFRYLFDRRRVILCGLILLAAVIGLMLLYGMALPEAGYCALLILTLVMVMSVPDLVRYCRSARRYEAVKRSALQDCPQPISPRGSLPEALLIESFELIRARAASLESMAAARQEELMDYYTLWVHQVKTPLSAMGLILQAGHIPHDECEALRQELFKIERYMEMLLGYLRLYSISSDLRLENCPVRPIAAGAVKKFATQFIYKKLSVDPGGFDNSVVTDGKWLLFVIEQLISNAVKYTNTGGITISMDKDDVLSISDTGIGIDPADLPRVCERGFTGRNGRRNGRADRSSTGLGLYLCKSVLDKLHTPFEIRSEPGKGTTVLLYLGRPRAPRD